MSEVQTYATPEGRLINNSLFEKDAFVDAKGRAATPAYKIEMAFEDESLSELEERVIEAAIAQWGDGAEKQYDDGEIRSPFLSGDSLAEEREKRGKKGDAYVGKTIVRASTIYNRHGEDGPGGVAVFGPDVSEIIFSDRESIYNGCHGVAAVTISAYDGIAGGSPGVKFYLSAFQKTRDGDRLVAEKDYKKVFSPVNLDSTKRARRAG